MQEANKIFVGNLPFGTTQDALKAAFSQFGEITDCYVPTDNQTGRLKPFGFVTFQENAGATAAIEGMNGKPLPGDDQERPLTVNLARPKEARPAGGFGGGNRSGGGYQGGNRGGFQPRSGGNNWGGASRDRGESNYGGNDSQE